MTTEEVNALVARHQRLESLQRMKRYLVGQKVASISIQVYTGIGRMDVDFDVMPALTDLVKQLLQEEVMEAEFELRTELESEILCTRRDATVYTPLSEIPKDEEEEV